MVHFQLYSHRLERNPDPLDFVSNIYANPKHLSFSWIICKFKSFGNFIEESFDSL
jgi:hypothetical protein